MGKDGGQEYRPENLTQLGWCATSCFTRDLGGRMGDMPDYRIWGECSKLWKIRSEQVFGGDLDSLSEPVNAAAHLVPCPLVYGSCLTPNFPASTSNGLSQGLAWPLTSCMTLTKPLWLSLVLVSRGIVVPTSRHQEGKNVRLWIKVSAVVLVQRGPSIPEY